MNSKGLIFDIHDFSIHDGHGVRSVVFFKGCPLRCRWCSNPEGQEQKIQTLFHSTRCQHCHLCYDLECPHSARTQTGRWMTVDEVVNRLLPNKLLYKDSGGGVTLSGGEPLLQPAFVKPLGLALKEKNISIGVETCGCFDWDHVIEFLPSFEFFYFDIKTTNPDLHKEWTQRDNIIILKNLGRLATTMHEKIFVTVALIPSFNDNVEEMENIATLCKKHQIKKCRLLPYHELGSDKYTKLDRPYGMGLGLQTNPAFLNQAKEVFEKEGIKILVDDV